LLRRASLSIALLALASCQRAPRLQTIRLIDRFDAAKVEGAPKGKAPEPNALWDFTAPARPGEDPLRGWKAGPGVTALAVKDGKLTGRTTAAMPFLYAPRPKTVDTGDAFDSVRLRMRVSAGANVSVTGNRGKPDFAQMAGMARAFPWPFRGSIEKGHEFHTLTLQAEQIGRMNFDNLVIRPTDVANATFEIESVQAISQRERRASVKSGIGWQGLGDIYHETLVSRSPEKIRLEVDVPYNAWLDLNLGTVEDHPVTFKVAAGGRTLLERTLTTPHRWEPAPVDLAGVAGRTTLEFSLDVAEERLIGFWGSPVIRVRGAKTSTRPTAGALATPPPQGVILIMCDTLRKDHLPAYGYQRDTAPHFSKLAEHGTVFLDAVTTATWTKVATPSIMTSMYPISHRVHDFTHRLSAAADTIAEVYRAAGYATVSYSSVLFTGKFTNLQQGFEELHESTSADDPQYRAKTARIFVDRASEWIGRHRDTPFFMFLHVFDPHDPFEPRPPYDRVWADPSKKDKHVENLNKIRKVIENPLLRAFGMPTKAEIEKAGIDPNAFVSHDKDWYDGSIRGMDAEVGRLVGHLRQLGLEKEVQIAIVADHGEEFIEHGRMFHGQSVYGELTGVPLLLYRPGAIPPGRKIRETVSTIDLMPTLLDLSGLAAPKRAQGQSLVPLLAAARGVADGPIVEGARALGWKPVPAVTEKAQTKDAGGPPPYETESYGIVDGGWKLVHNVHRAAGAPEFELYHHAEDPLNMKNVADQNKDKVEKLRAKLAEWRKMVDQGQLPKGDAAEALTPQERERLKSLGYVQ
jgi:arylsulfatase A-like enzyme